MTIPLQESDRVRRRDIEYESLWTIAGSIRAYRDRNYIIKDIISKLVQHGELKETSAYS